MKNRKGIGKKMVNPKRMKQVLAFTLLLFSSLSTAQFQTYKGSALTLGVAYMELKDELNHGFVFRGPDVRLTYSYEILDEKKHLNLQFGIGGGGKTTRDTWAGTYYLAPIVGYYAWNVLNIYDRQIYIGPTFKAQYHIQNYPELHAGPPLWLTSYELGFHFSTFFKSFQDKTIELSFDNNLFALNSRSDLLDDPYYFTTKLGESFSDFHRNAKFGGLLQYIQTEISAKIYFDGKKRRSSLGYTFNITRYSDEPKFTQIFHQLNYKWFLKKSKS